MGVRILARQRLATRLAGHLLFRMYQLPSTSTESVWQVGLRNWLLKPLSFNYIWVGKLSCSHSWSPNLPTGCDIMECGMKQMVETPTLEDSKILL